MKIATATLISVSPYSQSRPYDRGVPRLEKESPDNYERRTWRNRLHVTQDGRVFIPPMSLKSALAAGARFLGTKIPGRRNSTYTKHFEAGVLVVEGPVLDIRAEDVPGEELFLNADGKRGSGTRVWRTMPRIDAWQCDAVFYVLDETITERVFREHLQEAGKFIGIGRFRPAQGGFYGRFKVERVVWKESEATESAKGERVDA